MNNAKYYKIEAYGSGKSCLTWARGRYSLEAKKHSLELDGYTDIRVEEEK